MSYFSKEIKNRLLAPYKVLNQLLLTNDEEIYDGKTIEFNEPNLGEIETLRGITLDVAKNSTPTDIDLRNTSRVSNPSSFVNKTVVTEHKQSYADIFGFRPYIDTNRCFGKKFQHNNKTYPFILFQSYNIPSNMVKAIEITKVVSSSDNIDGDLIQEQVYDALDNVIDNHISSQDTVWVRVNFQDENGYGGSRDYIVFVGLAQAFKTESNGVLNVSYDTSDYVETMIFNEDSQVRINKVKIKIMEVEL